MKLEILLRHSSVVYNFTAIIQLMLALDSTLVEISLPFYVCVIMLLTANFLTQTGETGARISSHVA